MSEGSGPGSAATRTRRPESDDRAGRDARATRRNAWLLVVALLAVPMAVIPGGDLTVVSLWGFLNTAGPAGALGAGGYPVWAYFLEQPRPFGALPASIRAWPLAIGFHLLAAASATAGVALGREDRRVTGGLLALAAAASLWVSVGVATRFGVGTTSGWLAVIPVGALATLAVVAGVYGRDLRAAFER
ncbi:TIGR04206 family protein [Halorubrum amylolyticum]|uniref:TIGR04206 family protein n=1 Tax=Halorubrum amylolyticum TaxID=2508724 RepID=UPI001008C7B8|nr:TIGR04206 family protein [Halorubrum amylolyticum]